MGSHVWLWTLVIVGPTGEQVVATKLRRRTAERWQQKLREAAERERRDYDVKLRRAA